MEDADSQRNETTADDLPKLNEKNNLEVSSRVGTYDLSFRVMFNSDFFQKEKNRLTYFAAWSAVFVSFAGSWQYGFSSGSFNPARLPAQKFIKEQYEDRWNASVTDEYVNGIWVACSAAFPAGGIFGSLLVGPVVKKFGRLYGLLFTHTITVILSVLLGLSKVFKSPEVIVISRFGIGITSGIITTGVTVMYLVEISPRHVRGKLGGFVAVGITFAIFLVNVLGLPQVFGNEKLWPLLFAITGIPSLLFILLHKTLPKSPRKLYIEDNNQEEAAKVLRRLNGRESVSDILAEMKNEETSFKLKGQMTLKEIIFSVSLRRALVSALFVGAAEQITGLNGINFNLVNIYQKAGISESHVYFASIGVTGCYLISICLGIFLVDKYGRRKLLLLGYSIMGMSMFLLAISLTTQHLNSAMAYISILASVGFLVGFSIGPGPVSLPIIAEFFEQNARSAAVSLAFTMLWTGYTFSVIVTPYMLVKCLLLKCSVETRFNFPDIGLSGESIRGYTFILFGVLCFLSVIFIWYNVPETKNKSFTEIKNTFRRSKNRKSEPVTEEATV